MDKKKVWGFFLLYLSLMIALIFGSMSIDLNKFERQTDSNEEALSVFKEEVAIHEEKVQKRAEERENSGRWIPSKQFVITAIVIASVLDIVIVLIWAWRENKKRAEQKEGIAKRLTESKWFWYIVGLGVVVPKENRLAINWINLVVVIILMYVLKNIFIGRLFGEQTQVIG